MSNSRETRPTTVFLIFWWGLSLILHLYAAWFSIGWHFPDEQMSIIEFMSHWLGKTPAQDLPWEFHWQIRPWMQPLFYGIFGKLFLALGWDQPFGWTIFFRMITGLLGWGGMVYFSHSAFRYMKSLSQSQWMVRLFSVLWFYPYLHVRTSSDCTSGIFILWMFGFLWSERLKESYRLILAGLCLGIAFDLRINMAMMVIALAIFWPWLKPLPVTSRVRSWFLLFIPAALMVGVEVILDRIGYGNWVFTPYTYAHAHFATRGNGYFEARPWYFYIEQFLTLYPIVSIPLMILPFVYWWKNYREPLAVVTFAFTLGHQMMSGRDYRFLFPVILLLPYIVVKGAAELKFLKKWVEQPSRTLIVTIVMINLIAVPLSAGRAANYSTAIYALVWRHFNPKDYAQVTNQLPQWILPVHLNQVGHSQTFYHPPNFNPIIIADSKELSIFLDEKNLKGDHQQAGYYAMRPTDEHFEHPRCQWVDQSMGSVVQRIRSKIRLDQGWQLYRCH